ncbi:MAG TPA: cation:proton antiporter [Terriglobales bacterium]|nr:cation:proton antiporter [Terriglobales bacterium]
MKPGADPFLLQLLVIFLWAKIFGELFEQLGLPAVLGEILSGVVLGPYLTGFVIPSDATVSIGELGAIFLLFTVGLQTRPKELIRIGASALGVASAGMVLPFVAGFAYMMARHHSPHESVFIAAAMVATSVGISARVLEDLNVMQTRPAKIILGAAVFDDILGMVLLAVVVGLVSSGTIAWLQLTVLLIEAVGFALVMIFFAPSVIQRMRPGLERMETHNAPLILALAICLALSVAAEKIGMASIIGAFFAGLSFAEYSPEWNLMPRASAINEFLAPYFFFIMGAKLNLSVFSGPVLISAAVVSVLAIVTKVVGCGLPVLREGWDTVTKVGIGMTPRGEVGLIVALLGLQMKVISEAAYAIVIFMTAATTLFAPITLRYLYKRSRQRPQPGGEQQPVSFRSSEAGEESLRLK